MKDSYFTGMIFVVLEIQEKDIVLLVPHYVKSLSYLPVVALDGIISADINVEGCVRQTQANAFHTCTKTSLDLRPEASHASECVDICRLIYQRYTHC